MKRKNRTKQDLEEIHYQLARVVLLLSRIGLENEADATLKLKTAMPRSSPPAPGGTKKPEPGPPIHIGEEGP